MRVVVWKNNFHIVWYFFFKKKNSYIFISKISQKKYLWEVVKGQKEGGGKKKNLQEYVIEKKD